MGRYLIHEDNIERLEKKLKTIENKCNKNGFTFNYSRVGEDFKEFKDKAGEPYTVRYIVVEADGVVKHNDWKFAATLEHHENGNVVRQFIHDVEVPERYYTSSKVCEHCNTKRSRKDTYLVYNEATGEFKQVGKTCLCEFTDGLDADLVAKYISWFDCLIQGEAPGSSNNWTRYLDTREYLLYATECVKRFGYWKTDSSRSTCSRANDYYTVSRGGYTHMPKLRQRLIEEMEECNFNISSDDNEEFVDSALAWIRSKEGNEGTYIHNLSIICSSDYVSARSLGFLASLVTAYQKELGQIEERKKAEEAKNAEASASNYVGEIGQRITVDVVSAEQVFCRESIYGLSFLYKFKDADGNIYMWFTGNSIDSDKDIIKLTGTIKEHSEFRDCKQNILTRCKIQYA